MSAELIISIISLIATFIVGIFTAIVTFRVGKFEHLEKLKKYEKNITNFELQFKDETWLYSILNEGEFDHYNIKSKKRIYRWWIEYTKLNPPILLTPHVDYSKLSCPPPDNTPGWCGSDGLTPPVARRVSQIGADKGVGYSDEEVPNPEDLF